MTDTNAVLANNACIQNGITTAYRAIHERIDCDLIRLQGLLCAMESVIELHPGLKGADPQTQALNSILYAAIDKVESALTGQNEAWAEVRGKS